MSDSSKIAPWCWPEQDWKGAEFDKTWHNVRAAELVVIERGLAFDYGLFLHGELGEPELRWASDSDEGFEYEGIVKVATAPLDARVRALVDVIKAQEEK